MKFLIINIVVIIILSVFCKWQCNKLDYWYKEAPTKCVVIDKSIRQYNNASVASRMVDLQYKKVLTLRSDAGVFDLTVSNDTYYSAKPGDTLVFSLSLSDMRGSPNNNENLPFVFGVWLLLFCIVRLFVIEWGNIVKLRYIKFNKPLIFK